MGKGTNKNYSVQDLPHNRKQVLKFAYKNRRITILGTNLLTCLFSLPFILFELWTIVVKKMYILDFKTATDANAYALTQYYFRIPFLMIAGLGFAGAVYVLRKICWDEPVAFWKDFGKGIKNSYGKFLGFSFILGLFMYMLEAVSNNLIMGKASAVNTMSLVMLALLLIVGAILFIYVFALSSMYNMSFFGVIKGAFILTFKKLFTNILMLLCGFGPILVLLILCFVIPYFLYVFLFLLAFGGISYMILVFVLFTNRQFDVFINGDNYPEYVNKGIYDEDLIAESDEFEKRTEDEIKTLAEKIAGLDKKDGK